MSKPAAVFIAGPAGAGKTTLAADVVKLGQTSGMPMALIDKDTICGRISSELCNQLGIPHDRDSFLFKQVVRPLEYACVLDTAREQLNLGLSVCLPAPWSTEIKDGSLWHLFPTATIAGVYLTADIEELRFRIEQRGNPLDDYKLRNWDEFSGNLAAMELHARERGLFVTDQSQPALEWIRNAIGVYCHEL